jgi:hypothetical protein
LCDSYKTKNQILNNLPFFRVSLWLSDASLNFLRGGGGRRRRTGERASVLLPGNLATALLPACRAQAHALYI